MCRVYLGERRKSGASEGSDIEEISAGTDRRLEGGEVGRGGRRQRVKKKKKGERNFPHFFIFAVCQGLYDVFLDALRRPRGGRVCWAACAAPRGAAEAQDAGSRRVHPLPRPCSQLGG